MYQLLSDHPDFIVISKSANVHFHSQDGTAGVIAQAEADLGCKLYPVHRLDTPTSGLLIVAKSPQAANVFTQMFTEHKVQKYYLAIACGKPKKKQGWIVGDMAKSRRSMYKLLRTTDNPAVTQFFSQNVAQGMRVYLLKPLSGKTHQLRVALASIGVPILGDKLYGNELSDRCYLHAYSLHFSYLNQAYVFQQPPSFGEQFVLPQCREFMSNQWQLPNDLPWPS
ncbi:TIGR01621 family pseudouridine synthase [Shewanella livingstonensis]|uniref:TIGR01621 family pseudouridine synthase n=1 Tax=Shewanella livingstonensis TaxID=150120 RepID=A0A3G8LRS4_9GAMM|nr:TIGR01621 family pseudouridine synthase [Shewanella livingstonensis]AZG71580.1 TIGR01621 family pseudouridine synthase [Shewanella livingstonensis]